MTPTLWLLPTLLSLAHRTQPPSLGPGRGAWAVTDPQLLGFSPKLMQSIAQRAESSMPVRYCHLVAVEGHLISETYFHNASETRYEADSLAKTMTAQVVGVAVSQGLIDLDRPIVEYGVRPRCGSSSMSPPLSPQNDTAACINLLRRLCPGAAPPYDCHGGGSVVSPKLPRKLCSESCLQQPSVQAAMQAANCSQAVGQHWCSNPPGDDSCWRSCITGESFFPHVTARHLLTQTAGSGSFAPGTQFTYDSEIYIDHLSYLITAVTGEPSALWATREYALPMGLPPDLFAYDDFGGELSAGGGQMMSCRDHLRVAQLLINRGRWANDEGLQPPAAAAVGVSSNFTNSAEWAEAEKARPWRQLLTEDYVAEFLQPSYPEISSAYGFLIWLNRPANAKKCCSPRWGGGGSLPPDLCDQSNKSSCVVPTCNGLISRQMIGDDLASAGKSVGHARTHLVVHGQSPVCRRLQ